MFLGIYTSSVGSVKPCDCSVTQFRSSVVDRKSALFVLLRLIQFHKIASCLEEKYRGLLHYSWAGPSLGSARARRGPVPLHLSGPDFSQKFHVVIDSNALCLRCYTVEAGYSKVGYKEVLDTAKRIFGPDQNPSLCH